MKRKKVAGCTTKVLVEVTSRRKFVDTEEMVQWRSINQTEVDNLWNRTEWRDGERGLGEVAQSRGSHEWQLQRTW